MRIRYIVNQDYPNGSHQVDDVHYDDRKFNRFTISMLAKLKQVMDERDKLKNELRLAENSLKNAQKELMK